MEHRRRALRQGRSARHRRHRARHALRLFQLFFSRNAFLPQSWDDTRRTFHAYALNEARLYEKSVARPWRTRV